MPSQSRRCRFSTATLSIASLIAQALTEPMRLLTHDRALARYSDIVICFG